MLTTRHPASSYGQPVQIIAGRPHGPADLLTRVPDHPPLTGTPRQIAGAVDIRGRAMPHLRMIEGEMMAVESATAAPVWQVALDQIGDSSTVRRRVAEATPKHLANCRTLLACVREYQAQASAKWWIDSRDWLASRDKIIYHVGETVIDAATKK